MNDHILHVDGHFENKTTQKETFMNVVALTVGASKQVVTTTTINFSLLKYVSMNVDELLKQIMYTYDDTFHLLLRHCIVVLRDTCVCATRVATAAAR